MKRAIAFYGNLLRLPPQPHRDGAAVSPVQEHGSTHERLSSHHGKGTQSAGAHGPISTHTFDPVIRFLSCRDQPKATAAPKTGRGAGTDAGAELRGVANA